MHITKAHGVHTAHSRYPPDGACRSSSAPPPKALGKSSLTNNAGGAGSTNSAGAARSGSSSNVNSNVSPMRNFKADEILEQYRFLGKRLGSGVTSRVHLAEDLDRNCLVAIKVIDRRALSRLGRKLSNSGEAAAGAASARDGRDTRVGRGDRHHLECADVCVAECPRDGARSDKISMWRNWWRHACRPLSRPMGDLRTVGLIPEFPTEKTYKYRAFIVFFFSFIF